MKKVVRFAICVFRGMGKGLLMVHFLSTLNEKINSEMEQAKIDEECVWWPPPWADFYGQVDRCFMLVTSMVVAFCYAAVFLFFGKFYFLIPIASQLIDLLILKLKSRSN